ncbi:MAG: histidine kinase [Bacteroidetes bacterium]|nr:histidine kinase [Bacteroidota bacterium]MBU1114599.1 histidine kinase [Bacteroidota bacterium]MBU1799637.1 histidine kinase [Bacteroidota bacterium]
MKKIEDILFSGELPSFYVVNAVGWISFITMDSLITTIWMEGVSRSFLYYLNNSLQWSTGFIATIILRAFYKKLYMKKISLSKTLAIILVFSFLSAAMLYFLSHLVYFSFPMDHFEERLKAALNIKSIIFRMTQLFPIMTAWSMLYFGIKFWFDISAERERAQKADFLAQSAQLQMLRYQVNPHFLFNSFSSLRALIRSNQKAAVEMVSKLSEFYRYSLITKNSSQVALIDEVEAIRYYAEIEKIRFDDKIEFEFNIDSSADDFPVPSFIIHPLIENAIKYGMKTSKIPLQIKIEAVVENKKLKVAISNSGKWFEPNMELSDIGTKTGLDNIRNRLAIIYPDRHKFDIFEENGFVKAILEIDMELS